MIYLDYTANTPADPDVLDAYLAAERRYIANPNSTHIAGQEARAEMERVTQSIAQHLGVQPAEIIYTSGASEANNLALKGIAHASRHIGKHIISTQLEHSSVGASLSALQQQGYEIDLLDIGRDGRVDLDQLRELMRDDTILVAVCAVDSELGTIQPIREIAGIVKPYPGCRLHVDATQAVGKTDLWLDGVDTMSFTAHKFYGPNGIGALYKRRGLVIEPQISGGASTTIYRSGTPTLGLAVSLDAALTKALAGQDARNAHVQRLHDRLLAGLQQYSLVRVNSPAHAVSYRQCQRDRRQGHAVSAGAERTGRLRVGQIGLLVGRSAVQGRVRRQPGSPQRAVQLAHQHQPLDHRRGDRRLPASL